jgi:hypothetical protein
MRWPAALFPSLALLATACGKSEEISGFHAVPAGGSAGSGTAGAAGGGGAAARELFAVPSQMRRLTGAEYSATVSDVLGVATALDLLEDNGYLGGFDNDAALLSVNPSSYELFLQAAEQVAHEVISTPGPRERVLTCPAPDDAACLRTIVSGAGLRLFRRPLLEQELGPYEQVYAAARTRGELEDAAIEQTLMALLASAQFLYRMEFVGSEPGEQPVGAYELASRLSYLLWSSAPDDALLAVAEDASLLDDAELEAQTARLWQDARFQRFAKNFGAQWLGARRLANHDTDPTLFPEWTPEVATAAAIEVEEYFGEFARQDLDWLGFLTGRAHYVNERLAALYGVEAAGAEIQRTTIEDGERAGYLGLIGFLTVTSQSTRTSPTLRGRFIQEHLLCTPLPPPPAVIPCLSAPEPDPQPQTFRERVESISLDPACASCHMAMDPLGLALEHYDAIGRYRSVYPDDGVPVDANDVLGDGTPISGLSGVIDWVTNNPLFQACLVRKLYTYGLGRMPSEVDEPNLRALSEQWSEGPLTVREAVLDLVLAKPFRYRSDGSEP